MSQANVATIGPVAAPESTSKQTEGFNAESGTIEKWRSGYKGAIKSVKNQREKIQEFLTYSAIHFLKHNDTALCVELIEAFEPMGGTMRVDNMVSWLKRVGVKVTVDAKGNVKAAKDKKFYRGAGNTVVLAKAREKSFWELTAKKDAKAPPEEVKLDNFAMMVARSMLFHGDMQIGRDVMKGLAEAIEQQCRSEKVKTWVETTKAELAERGEEVKPVAESINQSLLDMLNGK